MEYSTYNADLIFISDFYSPLNRENQLIEEMAELTQAIMKLRRTDIEQDYKIWENYLEEIADVKLCLKVLIMQLSQDAHKYIQKTCERKAKRQVKRIEEKQEQC